MTTKQEKVLDALNRIDELACIAVENNDNGEAQQLDKDYKLVLKYILSSKNK